MWRACVGYCSYVSYAREVCVCTCVCVCVCPCPRPDSSYRPCSFGGAVRVSQFIYLACGYDGANNQSSSNVYRAQILDPLAVPTLDLSLIFNISISGISAGRYVYRVSPLYPARYHAN